MAVDREAVTLPADLDAGAVRAVAMDLDRTILGESLELRPRLVDAVTSLPAAGITPIVATGRMFRSSRPFALQMDVTAPVICYQGALIADPVTGEWLRHEPMPVPLAKEVILACQAREQHCNVYIDDELYVIGRLGDSMKLRGQSVFAEDMEAVVKAWFRSLALDFHPDKRGSHDGMIAINEAHHRLRKMLKL